MKTRLLAFIFAFSPSFLMACSCLYYTSFCEGVSEKSEVVSVQIFHTFVHDGIHFVNAEFLETVQGTAQFDTVTLHTGSAFSICSAPIEQFRLGDTLIFSIGNMMPDAPSQFPTYFIEAVCSTNFRIVDNGMVTAGQSGEPQLVTYPDFVENFSACSELTNPLDGDWELEIFPVPASTELKIINPVLPSLQFEIYSMTGRLVSNTAIAEEGQSIVDVSDFPAGMYFIRFRLNGEERLKRFVVH